MEQHLDSSAGERSSYLIDKPFVVLQERSILRHHRVAVVLFEKTLVGLEIITREGFSDEVLFTDNYEFASSSIIPFCEKVEDCAIEGLNVELDMSVDVDNEGIEVVFLESP